MTLFTPSDKATVAKALQQVNTKRGRYARFLPRKLQRLSKEIHALVWREGGKAKFIARYGIQDRSDPVQVTDLIGLPRANHKARAARNAEWVSLRDQGYSYLQISKLYGVCESTVRYSVNPDLAESKRAAMRARMAARAKAYSRPAFLDKYGDL